MGIRAVRQFHPVGQDRLQDRPGPVRLDPQPLSGEGVAQARHSYHGPGLRRVHGAEFRPGIEPELIRLFLPDRVPLPAGKQFLGVQRATGDLHVGQPGALRVPRDLEHLGAEFCRIVRLGGIPLHAGKQLLHALYPQCGAEEAGKQLSFPDQTGDHVLRKFSRFQILLQGRLVADGGLLPQGIRIPEVHAAAAELVLQMGQQGFPVRPRQIHLVNKEEGGNLIPLQQIPQRPGVALDAVGAGDHQHSAVQHLKGPLHLGGKIHMAGGVQQRHPGISQFQHRLLGENGDAPLALHVVGVQKGVLMVHPAQAADGSGPVQQGL